MHFTPLLLPLCKDNALNWNHIKFWLEVSYFRAGKESRLVLDIQRPAFKENEDPSLNTTAVQGRYKALRACVQEGSFDVITSLGEDDVIDKYTLTYLEETSLELLQKLPAEDLYMAWYPMAYGNKYKACYIKIRSLCGDTEVRSQFITRASTLVCCTERLRFPSSC